MTTIEAMELIMGKKVYQSMVKGCCGVVEILKTSGLKCFENDYLTSGTPEQKEAAMVIKKALLILRASGMFDNNNSVEDSD